jgi:phage minor structural protein
MDCIFLNASGTTLFARNDMEAGHWVQQEMNVTADFPFVADKVIERGMRIAFRSPVDDVLQVFEVRIVTNQEPEHYQQITAEHICVSELTDDHINTTEITGKTAAEALTTALTGTLWSVGNNSASGTQNADFSRGSVWDAVNTIQQNWNVYIIPRIVVGTSGITNKYLDIMPAEGTWRGFRISLDKNANEIGVIWDDSKLKTALYAFGQEKNKVPLTFADVVWTATADHPAKPSGQTYLEDPTATAAYGRNGRPRFGYYQNASITDAATLLQKTWEVLQTVSIPDVTVNATVADLHRLGYVDVPLRLHDTALIEVRPTSVVLQKEIIQYTEDLLDPLQSRLTIGTYIPNIIYINRENAKRGGGGGGSGDSQTPQEYTTENNTVQINKFEEMNVMEMICLLSTRFIIGTP